MRGVHHPSGEFQLRSQGSSPHARGPPEPKPVEVQVPRIIPACAGSTPRDTAEVSLRWDHPRMRGVHHCNKSMLYAKIGSSPHARGPPVLRSYRWESGGIIPACAGSTRRHRPRRTAFQDHPRMRGVHRHFDARTSKRLGSSPHARGPLSMTFLGIAIIRIIPACAGSTIMALDQATKQWDHPRMRGVHAHW